MVQGSGIDENAMTAPFVIVTRADDETVNRNGNMVQIMSGKHGRGMMLGEYQRNPVVLLDHGHGAYPFAIGLSCDKNKTCTVKPSKRKATAVCHFRKNDPWAEFVFAAVAENIMSMASVAYRALKAIPLQDRNSRQTEESPAIDFESRRRWYDFVESELLEWSITTTGADRGAFRQSLDCGKIGQFTLTEPIQRYVQTMAEEKPAWAPGWTPTETQAAGVDILKGFGVTVSGGEGPTRQFLEWAGQKPAPVAVIVPGTPEVVPVETIQATDIDVNAIAGQIVEAVVGTTSKQMADVQNQINIATQSVNYLSGRVSV